MVNASCSIGLPLCRIAGTSPLPALPAGLSVAWFRGCPADSWGSAPSSVGTRPRSHRRRTGPGPPCAPACTRGRRGRPRWVRTWKSDHPHAARTSRRPNRKLAALDLLRRRRHASCSSARRSRARRSLPSPLQRRPSPAEHARPGPGGTGSAACVSGIDRRGPGGPSRRPPSSSTLASRRTIRTAPSRNSGSYFRRVAGITTPHREYLHASGGCPRRAIRPAGNRPSTRRSSPDPHPGTGSGPPSSRQRRS